MTYRKRKREGIVMLTLDKIYHAAFVLKDVARKTDLIEEMCIRDRGGPDNGFYKVNADASTDFETTLVTYNINFWEITEIHKK